MKAARYEMQEHVRLETTEASEGLGAQEQVEFEARAVRERKAHDM